MIYKDGTTPISFLETVDLITSERLNRSTFYNQQNSVTLCHDFGSLCFSL